MTKGNATNQVKAGSAGAIEAVVAAMREHAINKGVQQCGREFLAKMSKARAYMQRTFARGQLQGHAPRATRSAWLPLITMPTSVGISRDGGTAPRTAGNAVNRLPGQFQPPHN